MHAQFAALLLAATALTALPAAGQAPAPVQPTETGARTAYPIAFFADHLEMASEMKEPPKPMTAAKISSDARFSPLAFR